MRSTTTTTEEVDPDPLDPLRPITASFNVALSSFPQTPGPQIQLRSSVDANLPRDSPFTRFDKGDHNICRLVRTWSPLMTTLQSGVQTLRTIIFSSVRTEEVS